MMFVIVLIMAAVLAYLIGFIKTLQGRIESLERQVDWLSFSFRKLPKEAPQPDYEAATETVSEAADQPPVFETLTARKAEALPRYEAAPEPPPMLEPVKAYAREEEEMPLPLPVAEPTSELPEFNWEQFLGAKMLAWLGGLALFVGIAFFVKYSFDRDLIPPWMRVAGGFAVGLGLVVAGVKIRTKQYLITAQTFVATGIVILYAVSFIARSFYHLIDTPLLFVLMCGVTVTAFTLAIRLDGRVIAVLGMLGGFITPQMVGFPREEPFALFGYVFVLNCGLLAVARRQNWSFLIPLAAISTVLTEMIWMVAALRPGNLNQTLLMIGALTVLFVGNARFNPDPADEPRSMFAGTLQSMAVLVTFWFVLYQQGPGPGPVILLSTLFFGNLALIALYAMTLQVLPLILAVSGCGGLLALWIGSAGTVLSSCVAALLYASLNALLPAWIAKWRDSSQLWPNIASVSGVALMLLVLFRDASPGWFFWPAVLLLNAVLLAVAFIRRSMILGGCGMALSAMLSVYWISHLSNTSSLVPPLIIIGAFALLYFFAAGPLSRRQQVADPNAIYFPAIPAAIPFLLLALLILRLEIPNPSLLFAFAMLLNALLILAAPARATAFPLVALIGSLLLEALWFTKDLNVLNAVVSFAWFLGFSLAFTFFPLLRKQSEDWLRWTVSAVAGPIHFGLLHATARLVWPEMPLPGLVPALLGLPALAMFLITRKLAATPEEHRRFTASYGASLLFFITFIFPIQFDRQWLTLGWALEGVALIWLNRRAPAHWLVALGAGLLAASFARLALNPLVFQYHERSGIPVLNWYLYTYGIVAVALFAAARLMAKNEFSAQLKGAFNGMGTVLLFLLINIEIADIFATGPHLAFEFSGNFARDMVYSIAWSLFALTLLMVGVKKEAPAVRYAGLALMGITLLKLFLHDLTQLDALFRIGAFIGVAIILIFASWLYQRFLSPNRKIQNSD